MTDTQRYRVNYRLLIGLVVGATIAAPTAYGLWWFQVDRNADRLLARADGAEERGEDEEVYDSLVTYIKLRRDDDEALVRLGHAAVKIAESLDVKLDQRKRGEAYGYVVEAVNRTGNQELRRELVDLHMFYGRPDLAQQTIEEIERAGGEESEDRELMAVKAQCLYATQEFGKAADYSYKLIGYDPKGDAFDESAALAPDQPRVYAMLAQYLVINRQPELAERVVQRMVEANPQSREAFMMQYELLRRALGKPEEARAALEKAYELEPTDVGVLLAKGVAAFDDYLAANAAAADPDPDADVEELRQQAEEHLNEALAFFTEGIKAYPDRLDFYDKAARVELVRKRYDEALAIIADGLERFDPRTHANSVGVPMGLDLVSQKVDILLAKKDFDGVRREIRSLRALGVQQLEPIADFFEANLEFVNENWVQAAKMFKDVRNRLISHPRLQALAATNQGICHTQLRQHDLALEAFNYAIEKLPDDNSILPIAFSGRDAALDALGRTPEEGDVKAFGALVEQELKKPKSQQNWTRVEDEIDAYIQRQADLRGASETWIKSRQYLLRAQMWINRGRSEDDPEEKEQLFFLARDAITNASKLDKDDITVQVAALQLLMYEPKSGPAKALDLLDKIVASRGDMLAFRLMRIDIIFALRGEQISAQLHAATEGMEDWHPSQQAQVWSAVATRFEQLGQLQDATLCAAKACELAPSLLPYPVALFELARKQLDDAGMEAAQKKILALVGSENSPDYVATVVKRLMARFDKGEIDMEGLKEARGILDRAIRERSTWAELYVLSGQLAMVLEKDASLALKNFEKALETGPLNLNALGLQIRLLAGLGRFTEAREKMDLVSPAVWTPLLDRVAALVLRNVGEKEEAFAEARKIVDANAKDANAQRWLAELAVEAEEFDAAESALKTAVELNASDPDMWMALLNFYQRQKRAADIQATIREAQLALDEEFLPLLAAEQYRVFGRMAEAESILLASYADRLDELPIVQRLAEFYMNWADRDETRRGQAAVYLNRILRMANEGTAPKADPMVAWARRQAAKQFSLTGDYQDSLKAEKLLAGAVAENVASPEGQELLVDILIRRGDPASQLRVVALLEKIQKERPLTPNLELQLGKAYSNLNEWEACKQHMEDAVGRYPDELSLRVGYVEMLIEHKDVQLAERWLSRLDTMPGAERFSPQLQIRLAAARGDKAQVRKLLEMMTPNLRALTPTQLKIVEAVATLAEMNGDFEYALRLMQEVARREPGHEFDLARFTAMYGAIEQGLGLIRQLYSDNIDNALDILISAYRARRSEAPEKFDPEVERLVQSALQDDPDSARRMVLAAESLEIREKVDEAIAAYSKLLARDDVPPLARATAQNNLAFLLAMKKQDLDRALEGVNEAIDIVGPLSDILDTRALVHYHRGDFDKAAADLRLAVKMGATASKYFHLAMALLAAGDEAGALDAWAEAEARGISRENVPTLERDALDEMIQKIKSLRTQPRGN
jgi:tetratricopeptide (TPR) repeat protein